jgi:glucose 1-dehydrogenase
MPACPIHKILKGQKALVTGANFGMGQAVAIALARAGADVVVNYVSRPDAAEAVLQEAMRCGANVYAHRADVRKEDEVQTMFKVMIQEFGTIDILVNNAGLQKDAPIDQMTLADWQLVLDVNLTGQFLCAREAIREFKRRGIRQDVSCAAGKIICMSSVHEVIPWAGHVNYASSRAASC